MVWLRAQRVALKRNGITFGRDVIGRRRQCDEVVGTAADERVHHAMVPDAVRHLPAQGVRAPSVGPHLRRGQRGPA